MKKEKTSLNRSFGPVKLFLADIQEIVEAFQKLPGVQLEITAAGYELSSVEEFSQLKQKDLRSLQITCKPSIDKFFTFFLKITEGGAILYSTEDTPIFMGVFAEVERLLSSRQRKFQWVEKVVIFVMPMGLLVSILIIQGQITQNQFFTYVGYGIAGFMIISLTAYLATTPMRKSQILLYELYERPSFWERNKDAIILVIITSILSVVGTLLIQALTK